MRAAHAAVFAIERPSPKLMQYYAVCSLLTGPFFLFVILPYFFKYRTLRYRFDQEGVSMRWGILFRREIILNYSRIQDIHLVSNVVERWFGLARLQIQTASGSASAEMTIEGIEAYEMARDFLYSQMRGQKEGLREAPSGQAGAAAPGEGSSAIQELNSTLQEVAAELRSIRLLLEKGRPAENREQG